VFKPAASPTSKSAGVGTRRHPRLSKSAIQQTWKSALHNRTAQQTCLQSRIVEYCVHTMKLKWETWFRVYLVVPALSLCWSVWRAAAQSTNLAPAVVESVSTNAPPDRGHAGMATPDWIQQLSSSLPFLTKQWFGNEVWKYLFSLIYIFLA